MRAEILSYSRSRGLFAGISLEGVSLRPDDDATDQVYGRRITARQIINGDRPGTTLWPVSGGCAATARARQSFEPARPLTRGGYGENGWRAVLNRRPLH